MDREEREEEAPVRSTGTEHYESAENRFLQLAAAMVIGDRDDQ